VQRPQPPIVVGGHSAPALRRAVRQGNGWFGWDLDLAGTADILAALRQTAQAGERPVELGELEITVAPKERVEVDVARRYADLGVHRLMLRPARPGSTALDEVIASTGDDLAGRV
jgi:alkanesulfonate monooxygenase SsuD/methylene tetrahydromethanopterin reductase-like flavin-dependent oxidoreductase (luciferase family)